MKQKQKMLILIAAAILGAAIGLASLVKLYCSNETANISFSNWVAVKPVVAKNNKFRFAVASMVSAEETWVTYKELIDYVASHIGNEASMVLRPSYSDVRVLLEEKKVDIALVCTGTYIACSRTSTVDLIAVPEFKNGLKYRCLFVVNKNSKIDDIAGLRGKSFAFTDPESNTGCIVPSWAIGKHGHDPKDYFNKIIYTGSHDRSLYAVAKGLVNGAGVDSLIFYSFVQTHPEMKEQLRVIWESEPFGAPPIVVPTGLSESMKEKLRQIFLSMSQDAKGREILDGIGIERFRTPQPDEYNSVYEIWDTIHSQK